MILRRFFCDPARVKPLTQTYETSNIISVVDSIAFQTSTLALNATVAQMDQAKQQNAAMVEEMAAASGLEAQALDLVKTVSTFKLVQRAVAGASLPGVAPPIAAGRIAAISKSSSQKGKSAAGVPVLRSAPRPLAVPD